jgi:tape measure domain-containing protein
VFLFCIKFKKGGNFMATIRNVVQLQDGMSPVILSMNNALNIVISSFEQMQRASGNSVDTASIQAARRELSSAEASFNQVEASIRDSNTQQQQFNNSIRNGQSSADGLASKIGNIVKAYLGFQAVKGIADISDQFVRTKARLDLMNDGLQTTEQLQNMVYQSSQRSRASYTDTASVVAKLGILAKDAFSSNQEAVAFAEQMNKQFKIGGASLEEQTAGMYQLTQAMASGKLQGDEFRSIRENAPMLAQAISEFTGKSMGDLKDMSSQGAITADVIKKSLFAAADETEARFAKMPKTIGEIWVSIKNQAVMAFQPILLKINEIANNPNINTMVSVIVGGFVVIANAGLSVINVLANIVAFFQSNWGSIEPIIWGIVAALVVYNGALLYNNILTGEGVIGKAAHAIVSWAETAALIAMTYAQYGLNAALALCPITWIIYAIIALIAIFYAAIGAMNKMGGTSISATGIIAGTFMALGATIYNIIAFIWNNVAAFVEFFANVFTNPVEAVKRLHINLALAIIDGMLGATRGCDAFATNMANAIIGGINNVLDVWNYFVDILSKAGIAEKLGLGKAEHWSYTTSITSDLDNAKANLESYLSTTPDNYIKIDRMESKDIGAAYNSGYAWGDNASNMFSLSDVTSAAADAVNYDDLLKNVDDTAANTDAIKDNLDITSEDLKYLRDIADRDTINRFTTADIKVEMTNHNSVNSELDLDGIINSLGQGLSEGINSVREGATYEL